jgi:hypothetical protein
MNDISKETLRKIKDQGIRPHTKGYFFLKRSTVWGLFCFSLVLGSIASSAVIFQMNNAEWALFKHFRHSIIEFILLTIPFLWILFLIGFTIGAFFYFRQTQGGYRYRTITVVTLSILLSIIGGTVMNIAGLSERIESVFEENIPFYRGVGYCNKMIWMSPDKGLLAGTIVAVKEEGIIELKDLDGKTWRINTNEAIWRGRLSSAPDLEIKLIGVRTGEDGFIASEVRPWHGRRNRNVNMRHHGNLPQSKRVEKQGIMNP